MGAGLKPAVRSFGRYELIEYLGCGGMSDVFVAVHSGLQRRVALKVLRPSLCRDPESVQRFLREGQCAARVSHPNVVDVLDVGVEAGGPYLVMELLEGETLEHKLLREGPMQLRDAVDLLLPVLDGVAATHTAGVLHRDIKPSNILLARSADGSLVPKLVDFGIATLEERRKITGALGPIGTPHYMSPEQARGERTLDERSDQYSLASVLYEMLTGREPFDGGDDIDEVLDCVAQGAFPRISLLRPDLPKKFQGVLQRATALAPRARFAQVSDFAAALLPFASERTRQLYVSREKRKGLMSAYLLSGRFRPDNDVSASGMPVTARPGNRTVRPSMRPRAMGVLALTMLLGAGAGVGLWSGALGGAGLAPVMRAETATAGVEISEAALGALVPQVLSASAPQAAALAPQAVTRSEQQPLPRSEQQPLPRIFVTPADANILLDNISVGRGSFRAPEFADNEMHELRVAAEGYVTRIVLFKHRPNVVHIALEPLNARTASR